MADLVKSRSKTEAAPVADAAAETSRLLKMQMAEMFTTWCPLFHFLISQLKSSLLC
jgi:hypothetical protein